MGDAAVDLVRSAGRVDADASVGVGAAAGVVVPPPWTGGAVDWDWPAGTDSGLSDRIC